MYILAPSSCPPITNPSFTALTKMDYFPPVHAHRDTPFLIRSHDQHVQHVHDIPVLDRQPFRRVRLIDVPSGTPQLHVALQSGADGRVDPLCMGVGVGGYECISVRMPVGGVPIACR